MPCGGRSARIAGGVLREQALSGRNTCLIERTGAGTGRGGGTAAVGRRIAGDGMGRRACRVEGTGVRLRVPMRTAAVAFGIGHGVAQRRVGLHECQPAGLVRILSGRSVVEVRAARWPGRIQRLRELLDRLLHGGRGDLVLLALHLRTLRLVDLSLGGGQVVADQLTAGVAGGNRRQSLLEIIQGGRVVSRLVRGDPFLVLGVGEVLADDRRVRPEIQGFPEESLGGRPVAPAVRGDTLFVQRVGLLGGDFNGARGGAWSAGGGRSAAAARARIAGPLDGNARPARHARGTRCSRSGQEHYPEHPRREACGRQSRTNAHRSSTGWYTSLPPTAHAAAGISWSRCDSRGVPPNQPSAA